MMDSVRTNSARETRVCSVRHYITWRRAINLTRCGRDLFWSCALALGERPGIRGPTPQRLSSAGQLHPRLGKDSAAEIQRGDFSSSILNETYDFAISARQHHDADSVGLSEWRSNGIDGAHFERERFFFWDDFDCAQQIVRVRAGVLSKRSRKLPLSLSSLCGLGRQPARSVLVNPSCLL